MSDQFNEQVIEGATNVIQIPVPFRQYEAIGQADSKAPSPAESSPVYDELLTEARSLDRKSKYRSQFDYTVYRDLELRYKEKPIRGGIVKSTPIKLVNSHPSCQQCLYSFEMDTYGRGCSHNCTYCYAKAELTVHGYWNNPIPVPVDLNEIRKIFYTVFETPKPSKWRSIMERRVPIRIGSMSDSFMWMDTKYKVTQEFLRILSFYRYPYVVVTRSDLIARDDYLALLRKDLCTVQFSIASTNDHLNKQIEPGAPSAKRRLLALEKLSRNGFWTTVRINPMFPIYPDGYFTNPSFTWEGSVPKFEYSGFEMVDEIADAGVPSVLAGFGRFSSFALNNIKRATGYDLRPFFDRDSVYKSQRDYHFSDQEIRHYYEELKRRCNNRGLEFSTCYIGNGEAHFWDHQDLWSNKKDCCDVKGRISAFHTDAREVPFEDRLRFTTHKSLRPASEMLHTPLGITTNIGKLKQIPATSENALDNA